MATIALTHCIPVHIYPGPDDQPPANLVVNVTGGAPGDGTVEVHSPGPGGPVVGAVPTGPAPLPVPVPGAVDVWLHYKRSATGPITIEVEVDITEPGTPER